MKQIQFLAAVLLIALFASVANAADPFADASAAVESAAHAATDAAHEAHDDHGEHAEASHGLPRHAPVLVDMGFFKINSSMVVVWLVGLVVIVGCQMATRNVEMVPSGLQNLVEMLVEGLVGFFSDILGEKLAKKTFWYFGTIFLFIIALNWAGLVPGIGTIGFGHADAHGHFHVTEPLFRGANADLNMTAAMAMVFAVMWVVWSIQSIGAGGMANHIFAVKGHGSGFMGMFLVLVFIFIGLIEIISIAVRPVALMFRLYGNVFAGENMLETIMHLGGPILGGILVLPFYGLELLVGLVQALVFALLASVFTSLMCEHHDEEHAH